MYFPFFIALFSTALLCATPKEFALKDLDNLIDSTEALVEKQKNLRAKVEEYLSLHDEYLLDMENKELLIQTANSAKKILEMIKKEKMASLFDPSFISEMTLFAKLSKRPSIPPLP